ncbi:hypothetical protein AB0I60_06240 [Actinosynnema sp. NPDC050436]|uniref:hypothetical protein n=1 Tax=Actinosynnema sp. NPDC050436 TaxID=3155659 RepID=UPI0033D0B6C9
MIHLAARPARAAALVAVALCAACTTAPAADTDTADTSAATSATGGPSSTFPPDVAAMRAHRVDDPKNLPDDLCALLTAAEVAAATGVDAQEGVAKAPDTCAWPFEAGDRPNSGLLLQAPRLVAWVGDDARVADRPAKRSAGPGTCQLKVLVHTATGAVDDRPALVVTLVSRSGDDRCPAAEALARLVLDRLPPA